MDRMSKAKLADVAIAAGVSPMTVSRVLNGRGGASLETCDRIRKIADEMQYRPNAMARGLKSDKSGMVGVVVPDIANPFFPEIIRGIESVAMTHGYNLLLCNVVEDADREISLVRALENQRVDGLIWCSARLPEKLLVKALQSFKAAVLVNRSVEPQIAGSITIDYRAGAADALRHLWKIGRRRIGVIAGPATSRGAAERLEGLRTVFAELGTAAVATRHCMPDVGGGAIASQELLTTTEGIDGLICYNDLNAVGALQTCEMLGIGVPTELSIVGFDGIPLAELVRPQLSTLHVDKYSIGQLGMRMLLDRMEGKFVQHSIVVRPQLIVRNST
jgi:LacI family transcriptional regulator